MRLLRGRGPRHAEGLAPGEALALIGACLMLLASLLPWYEVDLILGKASLDGWQEPGRVWSVLAVLVSLLVAILILKRSLDPESLPELQKPLSWGLVLACGSAVPLVCVALKLLNDSDFVAYGFYVAFVAGVLLAAGGALIYLEEMPA